MKISYIPRIFAVCFDTSILKMDEDIVDDLEYGNFSSDDLYSDEEIGKKSKKKKIVEEVVEDDIDDDGFIGDNSSEELESEEAEDLEEEEKEDPEEAEDPEAEDPEEEAEDTEIKFHRDISDEMREIILRNYFCAFSYEDVVTDDEYTWAKTFMLSESGYNRIFINRIEIFVSGMNKISEKNQENIDILRNSGFSEKADKL